MPCSVLGASGDLGQREVQTQIFIPEARIGLSWGKCCALTGHGRVHLHTWLFRDAVGGRARPGLDTRRRCLPGILDAGWWKGPSDCMSPESARKQPCDNMTHLCPNYFVPECWLLGRVGALDSGLWGFLVPPGPFDHPQHRWSTPHGPCLCPTSILIGP